VAASRSSTRASLVILPDQEGYQFKIAHPAIRGEAPVPGWTPPAPSRSRSLIRRFRVKLLEAEGYRYAIRLKASAVLERHIALETTESHLSDLFRDRPEIGKARSRPPAAAWTPEDVTRLCPHGGG
jgi:hypothetical protein